MDNKFRLSRACLFVVIGPILSACSTSLISTVEPLDATAIEQGVPYRLPVAELDLTITRVLTRCEVWTVTYNAGSKIEEVKNDKDQFIRIEADSGRLVRRESVSVGAPPAPDPTLLVPQDIDLSDLTKLELEFKVLVAHEMEFVDGELLSIDPAAMASTFKTSSLDIKYQPDSLQLKSVNSTIEGKEAESLGAGIKLAASAVSIALGIPPAGAPVGAVPAEGRSRKISLCTERGIANTKAYAATAKQLAELTTEATNTTSQIEDLKKKKEAGTASAADLATLSTLTQTAKNLAAQIKDATNEKQRLTKILSISNSRSDFRKVPAPRGVGAVPPITFEDKLSDHQLNRWLQELVRDHSSETVKQDILGKTTVYGVLAPFANQYGCTSACSLETASPHSDPEVAEDETDDRHTVTSRNGILYRIPALSLLLITIEDPADRLPSIDAQLKRDKDLIFESVRIPQLGPLRSLPLKSSWGEKNNLTVSFGKDGMPTAVAYTREVAPGAGALSAADEPAQAVLGIRDRLDAMEATAEADLIAAEQAEIDALARQIDLAKKQEELATFGVEPDQELADLEAQLARLTLLAAIREQEEALAEGD